MKVPSWLRRPDSTATAEDSRGQSRARRHLPTGSKVEQLESRQLLATAAFLAGVAPTASRPPILTGLLNPSSDSGASNLDAVTNVSRPNFSGTATPGAIIQVYAVTGGTVVPVEIGRTVADVGGSWNVTSATLPDGRYTIEAIGTDPARGTAALDVILPNALQGPLVVSTSSPRVTNILFQPLTGRVEVSLQDGAGGLDQSSATDATNYSFQRVSPRPSPAERGLRRPGFVLAPAFVVTGVTTAPQTSASDPQLIVVTIDNNQPIRAGFNRFTIRSGGIRDLAGNALDGEFSGSFPAGNNAPGGDFVADLLTVHNTVLQPLPTRSAPRPIVPPGVVPIKTFEPTTRLTQVTYIGPANRARQTGQNVRIVALPQQNFPGTYNAPMFGTRLPTAASIRAHPNLHAIVPATGPIGHLRGR